MAEQLTCDIDELASLFLFESLSREQLTWLCEHGAVEIREPGLVYREGDPATCFFVLLDGEVVLSRLVGNTDVEISRTEQAGVYAGAIGAYLGDRIPQTYMQTIRTLRRSRFYVLSAPDFATFMATWFPMAVHLLEGLFLGTRRAQDMIVQRERLLALGSLSAGLTHELNNPAAAAVRATSALRERVAGMRHKLAYLAKKDIDPTLLEKLIDVQEALVKQVAAAPKLTAMQQSDREDEVGDWFEDHGIDQGWDLA